MFLIVFFTPLKFHPFMDLTLMFVWSDDEKGMWRSSDRDQKYVLKSYGDLTFTIAIPILNLFPIASTGSTPNT